MSNKPAPVYLVGAGPGHPGLITVEGLERLRQADVVVYDHLVHQDQLRQARGDAELIYVGKHEGVHALEQDRINRLLIERAQLGKTVVRLKGGDPFVFGRGAEEALALREAGVPFRIVPGVTAGVACAAWAGIPVTHRHMASTVAFVTGHEAADKSVSSLDWDALARGVDTVIFYMGVRNLASITSELIEHGRSPATPSALVSRGTLPRQRTVVARLDEIAQRAAEADMEPPAIFVVGATVSLRDSLAWCESLPLFGRTIFVTRPRSQADALIEQLRRFGAEAVAFPTIRITAPVDPEPIARSISEIRRYAWLIFTSANGVDAFFRELGRMDKDARWLAEVRVATIGSATAAACAREGVRSDFTPSRQTSLDLAREFVSVFDVAGSEVLLVRAASASRELVEYLEGAGAHVTEVDAYRVEPDTGEKAPLLGQLLAGAVDLVTLTSPSTAEALVELIGSERVGGLAGKTTFASIGPVTTKATRGLGLNVSIEADPHDTDGLVTAILTHFAR